MLIVRSDEEIFATEWRVVVWNDETDWSIPGDEDDIERWADDGGC